MRRLRREADKQAQRLLISLVAAVLSLVTAGVALMPSPWGTFSWWGWEADQRADLGSALITGALIGAVLLAAERLLEEQRVRSADRDRRERIKEAARTVNVTLVRYVDALQTAWLRALQVYKSQAIERSEQLGSDLNEFWRGGLTEANREADELWTVTEIEDVLRSAEAFLSQVPFGAEPRLTDAHLLLHSFVAELLEGSRERPLQFPAPAPHEDSVRLLPWSEEVEEVWVTTQRVEVSPDLGAVVDLVVSDLERAIASLYVASPREVRPLLELRDRVFVDWRRRLRLESRYRWAAPTLRLAALRLHDEFRGLDSVGRVPVKSRLRPSGAPAGWWDARETRRAWMYRLREVARHYDPDEPDAAISALLADLATPNRG